MPARVYASPLEIYPGRRLPLPILHAHLSQLGYRNTPQIDGVGQFSIDGSRVAVFIRAYDFPDGAEQARHVLIEIVGDNVVGLASAASNAPVALARLEPLEVGQIHPLQFEDRILLALADVPEAFIDALLALEDRRFYQHHGVDAYGLARALYRNLLSGSIRQGGSTITQQLVKNLFLSHDRTFSRKFNEALMALSLEYRYSKTEILETYINEVFLGQDGNRAIHGFGLAAYHYFGRPLEELALGEYSLLIGMVKAPSAYHPRRHPEAAKFRRNSVLAVLAEREKITAEQYRLLSTSPLVPGNIAGVRRGRYEAFIDLLRRQLLRDYRDTDLKRDGLSIFSTLDVFAHDTAERALKEGLEGLSRRLDTPIETAIVVIEPHTSELKTVIGGSGNQSGGFNRAIDAKRQIGSLVKPFVYLSALERPETYSLMSRISDAPVSWRDANGELWRPKNYDGRSHGDVTLLDALVHSYNIATVRLGLDIGVDTVSRRLANFGLYEAPRDYPSMLLGALDLTPVEVAQIYQPLANDGFKAPLKTIRAVIDAQGERIRRYPLQVDRVLDPDVAFLMQFALSQVIERGTGRSASKTLPAQMPLAGKTGTSNDTRDSWFAGFGSDYLAVVWVGNDDNRPTGLTGASGALPIWSRLMQGLAARPLNLNAPQTVAWIHASATVGQPESPCTGDTAVPYIREYPPSQPIDCRLRNVTGILPRVRGFFE